MQTASRLEHFPISFFAMIMGLSGLTIAWEKIQHVFSLDFHITSSMAGITAVVFLALVITYVTKLLRFPDAVAQELHNPIKLNFFPAISISLLLLSIAFLSTSQVLSHWLWLAGSVLHLGLTLFIFNAWVHHEHFEVHHLNPAWFIPAVGNVLVPVAGTQLGYTEVYRYAGGKKDWQTTGGKLVAGPTPG